MVRGLVWLSLLGVFFWLAGAGWNEYRKLEGYQRWATQFERAKYDIYSVLGQKGDRLTWGKPTRRGITDEQTFSLQEVLEIELMLDDQAVDLAAVAATGELPAAAQHRQPRQVGLAFQRQDADRVLVPFTELNMAMRWGQYLYQAWQALQPQPEPPT